MKLLVIDNNPLPIKDPGNERSPSPPWRIVIII